jgi:hypothetical protein
MKVVCGQAVTSGRLTNHIYRYNRNLAVPGMPPGTQWERRDRVNSAPTFARASFPQNYRVKRGVHQIVDINFKTRSETLDASIPMLGIFKLDLREMCRLAEKAMNNREAMLL